MRRTALTLLLLAAALGTARAQQVHSVYNRDTGQAFRLKSVNADTTVIGPIVKTKTLLTYDNPYRKLTEASINFGLPAGSALSGFAYYYKDEYVRGTLMDKEKAWFIYTAITSRNRDPGIMEQVDAQNYHAQIYPLAIGYDLRVELTTVGFARPRTDRHLVPQPSYEPMDVPYEAKAHATGGRTVMRVPAGDERPAYAVAATGSLPFSVEAVSQRFAKDGRIYTAGVIWGSARNLEGIAPTVEGLEDVTVVDLSVDGGPEAKNTYGFVGWSRRADGNPITVEWANDLKKVEPAIEMGSEAAQLWAHQQTIHGTFEDRDDLLRFSMKYQVPSRVTALLAVPQEEMRLYRQKVEEYNRLQAQRRRQQLKEERSRRRFANGAPASSAPARNMNWNSSGGGDPEIRVAFPRAEKVHAILPDGQVLTLKRDANGYWGGNFDIPATAREGKYRVRIVALNRDGTMEERTIEYDVDRTAPKGEATITKTPDGGVTIEVRSEPGLAQVEAYLPDGTKLLLEEVLPGVYRLKIPREIKGRVTLVLKDKASNKWEIVCSSPR